MNESQLIDLHCRKLEADLLTGAEELELFSARSAGNETGAVLRADLELHEQLTSLFRFRATAAGFGERCHARVVASAATAKGCRVEVPEIPAVNTRAVTSVGALKRRRGAGPWRGSFAGLMITATLLAGIGLWLLWLNLRPLRDSANATAASSGSLATRDPERAVLDSADSSPAITVNDRAEMAEELVADAAPDATLIGSTDDRPPPTLEMLQPSTGPELGRLSQFEGARWTTQPRPLTSFPARYELAEGTAAIELDGGATVVFQGPARLTIETPRKLSAEGGTYRIQTLDGREVSFTTPEVRIDQPGGGTFFLKTGDEAGTLVDLDSGKLVAHPWSSQLAKPINLSRDGLNRGFFSPAWNGSAQSPAVAAAVGNDGAFEGVVEVAGQPLTVTSPQVMSQVVNTATRRIQEQPEQFPSLWQQMVGQLEGAAGGQGSLSVNGQSHSIDSPQEWLEQMEQMRQRMAVPGNGNAASASSTSGFQGSLNFNGVEQKFDSQEEFEKARREAFGPLFSDFFRTLPDAPPELPGESSRSSQSGLPTGGGNSMSVFSGMINNNGNIQQFTRPEDFQRAMRQFNLGPRR